MRVINSSSLLLLALFLFCATTQNLLVYPEDTYNSTVPSSRACFSDCQYCQILTNQCEQCLSPYFQKDSSGSCVLIQGYTIESSINQAKSGQSFLPSPQSWSNTKTTKCNPNTNYTGNLTILGPFNMASGLITYMRTVSTHRYMIVKFFLLKMNWQADSSMQIIIKNQNNVILSNQTIRFSSTVPKEQLCSTNIADQRYSFTYTFSDTTTTELFISFVPSFSTNNTQWAISTFLVLSGKCDQSCQNCQFSLNPSTCTSCKNFLVKGSNGLCSQCQDGFYLTTVSGTLMCQKCPIQYKQCIPGNQICFYQSSIPQELNFTDCTFNSSRNYFISDYYVNTDQFVGSLFTVGGIASNYQCGTYSIVGLAKQGQGITRIISSMNVHSAISLTFNVFQVDQRTSGQNVFQIYLDNQLVDTLYLNMAAVSNICGDSNYPEVFTTFPATKFFNHNSTSNVNITIISNAVNWGIRNFRVTLQVCDSTCLQCGTNGCQTCPQYYHLQQLQCKSCLAGNGQSYDNSQCLVCTQNCLKCSISNNNNKKSNICITCQQGFFVYEGVCQKGPNVGSMITQPPTDWKSDLNGTTEQNTCVVSFGDINNANSSAQTLNFLVGQDSLTNKFTLSENHYKMLVSFYLIKIDDWNQNDQLNLYLNDLLVLQKSYSSFGNKICYVQGQNDFISYEQLQLEDSNQTLTARFQVVHAGSVQRRFGIANFSVYPVDCPQCSNYDFEYKIDYNYDQSLNIQIIFNRVYVNRNQTEFKKIFQLYINGFKSDYKTTGNDTVRYFISAYPDSQIILQNVTVICRYPEKVTTDISNPVNQDPFFQGRLLQTSTKISNAKSLSNTASTISIDRFSPVDNSAGADGLRVFFQVVSRIVIYLGFASFFIGCQTSCTHFMHNLQKIWIHIYVASLTIPSILKISLTGFRQTQDQNIAIDPTGWQKGIPTELYYDAPAQYQQYYHDITFFRNIYNVGFAAAIFLVFALLMYFIFSGSVDFSRRFTNNKIVRHMRITFYRRVYFVFNSLIFYQYLTVCLACTLQFIDLSNNTHQQPFTGINAAAAIIAFVLATLYPIFHFFYMSYKQTDMYGIDYEISFRNRYHQIFYRFQPNNLWRLTHQSMPIGFSHRLYNLYRFGQIWWMCIIVALMYNSPFAQAFLLMITNFFHFMLMWFSGISYTQTFKFLKIIELLFFIGIQIILLVTFSQVQTLNTESFKALGIVGVVFIFVIILCSLLRFLYTFKKIYQEYDQVYIKQNKMDQRLRNDDYYNSFQQDKQKIYGEQQVDTRR